MNSGEESALPKVSSLSSASCKYEGIVSLEDSWRSLYKSLSSRSCRIRWAHVEEVVLAQGPHSSIGGEAQCFLIGNVTWEVVLDEGIEEEDVSVRVRAREVRKCKHGWHGDESYFVRTTQPWNLEPHVSPQCECGSCVTGECACRSVSSSVNNWTETHHQLKRQTCPSQVEGQTFPTNLRQNKGTRQRHSFFVFSHLLGTFNLDFNTVRSPNVSGQWSREFQPLCLPYLDSPDSQSHVLGYSHWTNQQQRGREHTVTLARVLWECPGWPCAAALRSLPVGLDFSTRLAQAAD